MSHGYLKLHENGEWIGRLETLKIDMRIKLVLIPENERRSDTAPVFEVHAPRSNGSGSVKVGVAFEKRMKDTDQPFYSLSIDDPSLDNVLYVTAFPAKEAGKFDIVWQRPRKQDKAA